MLVSPLLHRGSQGSALCGKLLGAERARWVSHPVARCCASHTGGFVSLVYLVWLVGQFVVGMLDEKIMNALADRTTEMPDMDAPIDPVSEEEFHAMLDSVCNDAELYVETLWESGARTSTGKRDLEFLSAGSRVKVGQDLVCDWLFSCESLRAIAARLTARCTASHLVPG
jgi:hypothetical protein